MSSPSEVAERRATVRQLAKTGASNRAIADQLGIGKDTVARDMSQMDDPRAPMAQRLARHLAQTEQAVSQVSAAVQAVVEARPAYTNADDETARRWCGALRAAADALAAQADAFADYYPCVTGS